MGAWHEGRLVCFDTESTGVDPHRDRIVTAACIEVGAGRKAVTRSWLVDPGIPIPAEATAVHGIPTDHAHAFGRPPVHAVRVIAEFLLSCTGSGIPVVGHNVVYDLTILWAELVRHDHHGLADLVAHITPVVDTKILEHHLDPYRPVEPKAWTTRPLEACGSHKLIDCCRLWGVALSEEEAHGAEADALAAGRLAWRLATDPMRFARYDSAKGKPIDRIDPSRWPLAELHRWQTEQFAAEAARYESYRRGEQRSQPKEGADPSFVAAREWPVQPAPNGWDARQLPAPRETAATAEEAVA